MEEVNDIKEDILSSPLGDITMTQEEMAEFVDFIRGNSMKTPEVVTKLNANIKGKLIAGQSYYIFSQMEKMPLLLNFMKEAEVILYDPTVVATLEKAELMRRYNSAKESLVDIMEYGRKFYHVNKGSWDELMGKQDEIKILLSALTEEQTNKLVDLIKKGEL